MKAFSRDANVTLGGDVSVAAGPIGRHAEAAITPVAAVYTYSRSQGLFAGISLEGTVIGTRNDECRVLWPTRERRGNPLREGRPSAWGQEAPRNARKTLMQRRHGRPRCPTGIKLSPLELLEKLAALVP